MAYDPMVLSHVHTRFFLFYEIEDRSRHVVSVTRANAPPGINASSRFQQTLRIKYTSKADTSLTKFEFRSDSRCSIFCFVSFVLGKLYTSYYIVFERFLFFNLGRRLLVLAEIEKRRSRLLTDFRESLFEGWQSRCAVRALRT